MTYEPAGTAGFDWFCRRGHGGSIRVESAGPHHGTDGRYGPVGIFPAVAGFWLGVLFLLVLAVTLHNIPEGMAVGVVLARWMAEKSGITTAGALALSLGIDIQNFPERTIMERTIMERTIISMPLRTKGIGKAKAFLYDVLSGVVGPIAAVLDHLGGGADPAHFALSSQLRGGGHALCGGGGIDSRGFYTPAWVHCSSPWVLPLCWRWMWR